MEQERPVITCRTRPKESDHVLDAVGILRLPVATAEGVVGPVDADNPVKRNTDEKHDSLVAMVGMSHDRHQLAKISSTQGSLMNIVAMSFRSSTTRRLYLLECRSSCYDTGQADRPVVTARWREVKLSLALPR